LMLPGVAGTSALRFGVGADKKRTRESAQTLLILRRRQDSSLSPARHAVPLATSGIECCEGLVMKLVSVHGSSLQQLRHRHAEGAGEALQDIQGWVFSRPLLDLG
jgi:hypothetical protein